MMIRNTVKIGFAAAIVTLAMGCQSTREAPQVSQDGLQLKVNKHSTLAYKKEGVDFAEYSKVLILPSQVAFQKDWQRNYNRNQSSISMRIKDEDVLRIKTSVAKLFDDVFKETFSQKDEHVLVDSASSGTLIIKPAIINLDINAPDTRTAANVKSYVYETGQATLFLELYDGVSGEILARIVDAELVGDRGYAQWANRASNTADAKRTIRKWATALREKFDQAHAK